MRRFILALLLFVAGVTLPGGAHSSTAQEVVGNAVAAATPSQDESSSDAMDPLTFYESPTFGYVIPWFEDVWHLESSESGSDGDRVAFRRVEDVVTFHGYEGDAGDPTACLNGLTEQLEQSSEVDVRPYPDANGDPLQNEDELSTWAIYFLGARADGSQTETVRYLECRRLVPNSAVLAITLTMPRDRFEGIVTESAYMFIDSVVMPRRSYELEEVGGQQALVGLDLFAGFTWLFPRPPGLLFDRSDTEIGMATLVADYDPNNDGAWYLYVQFENTGKQLLTVDPFALTAMSGPYPEAPETSEDSLRPTNYRWETGEGDPTDARRTLEPGRLVIVRLTFAKPFFGGNAPDIKLNTAVYETEQTQSSTIGSWDESQGGGGRPRFS